MKTNIEKRNRVVRENTPVRESVATFDDDVLFENEEIKKIETIEEIEENEKNKQLREIEESEEIEEIEEIEETSDNRTQNRIKIMSVKALTMGAILCTVAISAGCNSSAENLEDAKRNVAQAELDLDSAQQEYEADVELFRIETAKKIAENEREIDEINVKIAQSSSKLRADYELQIDVLDEKNKTLKKKMRDYRADTKENWQEFKKEFNNDMTELGVALKKFTVDN